MARGPGPACALQFPEAQAALILASGPPQTLHAVSEDKWPRLGLAALFRSWGTQKDLEYVKRVSCLLLMCPQVSALQQGSGVRDGAAEEEGTTDMGPKRLWKVGAGKCPKGTHSPQECRAQAMCCLG